MRHINESIIGRKSGSYQSIILIPFGSDYTTFLNNRKTKPNSFRFGKDRLWVGFTIPKDNPELAKLIGDKRTRLFISPNEINKFKEEFMEINRNITSTVFMNDPTDAIIAPQYSLKIYPDELKNYIK